MAIQFFTEDISSVSIKKIILKKWISNLIQNENCSLGDLNIIFCSDDYILNINNQYLKHDYYTDIITFDYCVDKTINGDLFISIDTVKTNSEKFKTSYNQELHRVIFHGVLHLIGYKDKTTKDEKLMREKENQYLEMFEITS